MTFDPTIFLHIASMQEKIGVPNVSNGLHIMETTTSLVFNVPGPYVQLCDQSRGP